MVLSSERLICHRRGLLSIVCECKMYVRTIFMYSVYSQYARPQSTRTVQLQLAWFRVNRQVKDTLTEQKPGFHQSERSSRLEYLTTPYSSSAWPGRGNRNYTIYHIHRPFQESPPSTHLDGLSPHWPIRHLPTEIFYRPFTKEYMLCYVCSSVKNEGKLQPKAYVMTEISA